MIGNLKEVSKFENTGFPEDEGQFLQSVMPLKDEFILPGRFAFNKDAHFTEKSSLLLKKDLLFDEWCNKWDMSKEVLLEKSPPNIIRTRFLQEVFPNSMFITIIRHPIANSYAVKKWTNDFFLDKLIKHWVIAHTIYFNDRKYLKNEILISYEDLIENPDFVLEKISKFIGYNIISSETLSDKNKFYFDLWEGKYFKSLKHFFKELEKKYLIHKYEKTINKFGYSFFDLHKKFS